MMINVPTKKPVDMGSANKKMLMFTLLREDVFPIGDLGIRRGMEILLFGGEKQAHETLIQRAEIWAPYRSVASLYLWKAQD